MLDGKGRLGDVSAAETLTWLIIALDRGAPLRRGQTDAVTQTQDLESAARAADTAKVGAKFDKGVLTVTVPFKELPGTTRIAINSGND
jgi:hypothetical protein